jgi:predicted DNA-binding transcriptional regulator AlpA
MTTNTVDSSFLTMAQVAKFTGMSPDWLWAQCRTSAVAHHRFGRSYRFSQQDLRDLAAQTAVTPTAGGVDQLTQTGERQGPS